LEPTSAVPPAPLELDEGSPAVVPSAPAPAPVDMPVRERSFHPRPAAVSAVPDEDDGPSAGPLIMLKSAFWIFKALGKFIIFAGGVLWAAESACRLTEKALGREVFSLPVRPSRQPGLPYLLPAGASWSQSGVTYSINEWGLRSANVSLIKAPNTIRIILLGGTFLFGEGLPAEETVAGRLEALLDQGGRGGGYEIINAGMWGYGPGEQWAFYDKAVAELKPDALVWLCEDKAGGFPNSTHLKDLAQGSILASSLFEGSHLARLLMRRSLAEDASPAKTDFLAAVQPAEAFARQTDVRFLYAVFPAREMSPDEWAELPAHDRIDMDQNLRAAAIDPRRGRAGAAEMAVARAVFEAVRDLKPAGGFARKKR
jgi:hypothetical protein